MSKQKKKWFKWHLFPEPKDFPIESVYEIVCLVALFGLCLFLYVKLNKVPVYDYNVSSASTETYEKMTNCADFLLFLPMVTDENMVKEKEKKARPIYGSRICAFNYRYFEHNNHITVC